MSPDLTGSTPLEYTMGIVVVAAFAACAAAVLPAVTMTATCRRTSSAAISPKSILLPLRPAIFDRYILTLDKAVPL